MTVPIRTFRPRWLRTHLRSVAAAGLLAATGLVAGMLPAAYASAPVTPVTAGYRDFQFNAASVQEPTASKPESKLWYNDGFWWASMISASTGDYRIFKLNTATQDWQETSVGLDPRNTSRADVLWDGTKLYVASHIADGDSIPSDTGTGKEKRLYRYSYNTTTKTYSLDGGFPKTIAPDSSETLVLTKESTSGSNKLWATWVESPMLTPGDPTTTPPTPPTYGPAQVMVNVSADNGATWGTPFVLPVTGANNLSTDDISSIIAYQGRIGIMWSNQTDKKQYFASRPDTTADPTQGWTSVAAFSDPTPPNTGQAADDHINIKVQSDGTGKLFAVVKTGFSGEGQPDIVLLACTSGNCTSSGSWQWYTVYTVPADTANGHTRPVLLIDTTPSNPQLHIFTSQPTTGGPKAIYRKSVAIAGLSPTSPLAAPSVPFIQSATDTDINNPTTTKQTVNSTTGAVVLASDDTSNYYLHNYLAIDTTPPTVTAQSPAPNATNVAVSTNVTATFSEDVTGVDTNSFVLKQGSTVIPAVVTYDSATKTTTLNPNADLTPGTTYTVQLTSAIKDQAGNALAPVTWTFTTASAPMMKVYLPLIIK